MMPQTTVTRTNILFMKKSVRIASILVALVIVFIAGEHVGTSIGELIYNLTH